MYNMSHGENSPHKPINSHRFKSYVPKTKNEQAMRLSRRQKLESKMQTMDYQDGNTEGEN